MKHKNTPREPSLTRLTLRQIEDRELDRFNEYLRHEHYLKSARCAGDALRYAAEIDGKWMAVLLWGAAALRLKDRDQWIGWDAARRHERLKLVVQNRRFLILAGVDLPNLASKTLSMCTRRLARDWRERFGYEPLLAESFVDPERFRGTSYKAAGWEPAGYTAGYARTRVREDFYECHGKPKQLWVKPLHPRARALLCSCERLEHPFKKALKDTSSSHAVVLKVDQMETLWKRLHSLPDPRRSNGCRYRLATVLSMVVLATLCGKQNLAGIVRLAQSLNQTQLRALRSWKNPRSGHYQAPCYSVFYRLLHRIDDEAFDELLTGFIAEQEGSLPRDLAIDGKTLKGTATATGKAAHLVSALDHHSHETLAQTLTEQKTNEITAARELLGKLPSTLDCTITFDAMHAQCETLRPIVSELQADYIVQIKDNQPSVHTYLRKSFGPTPFFSNR